MTSVAIVTGAARGIGAACAQQLAGTVDALVLADVNDAVLRENVAAFAERGTRCEPVVVDLADAEGVRRLRPRRERAILDYGPRRRGTCKT